MSTAAFFGIRLARRCEVLAGDVARGEVPNLCRGFWTLAYPALDA